MLHKNCQGHDTELDPNDSNEALHLKAIYVPACAPGVHRRIMEGSCCEQKNKQKVHPQPAKGNREREQRAVFREEGDRATNQL